MFLELLILSVLTHVAAATFTVMNYEAMRSPIKMPSEFRIIYQMLQNRIVTRPLTASPLDIKSISR